MSGRRLPALRLSAQIGIAFAAFALVSGVAGLLGAANLGTALAFGQLAFVPTAAGLIIKT